MKTKLAQLQALMATDQWDKALSFAAKFPRLGAEKAAIVRAHEAVAHPRFYQQLGLDLAAHRQAGIDALTQKYQR